VIIGSNQEPIKQFKKNLLPPFDNEGWVWNASISDDSVFADGYSISFLATQYQGVSYYVPNSYAGRTFSLSIENSEGGSPYIEIIYETSAGTSYKGSRTGKLEGVAIPSNAKNIRCKVSNTSSVESQMYFKNIQLEESIYCTPFEEQMAISKPSKKGLRLFKDSGVTLSRQDYLSTDGTLNVKAKVTPIINGMNAFGGTGLFIYGSPVISHYIRFMQSSETGAWYVHASARFNTGGQKTIQTKYSQGNYSIKDGVTYTISFKFANGNMTLGFVGSDGFRTETSAPIDDTLQDSYISRIGFWDVSAGNIRGMAGTIQYVKAFDKTGGIICEYNFETKDFTGDYSYYNGAYDLPVLAKKRPKKNIFDMNGGKWENKTGGGSGAYGRPIETYANIAYNRVASMWTTPIEPLTNYIITKTKDDVDYALWYFDLNGLCVQDTGWKGSSTYSFKTPSNAKYFSLVLRKNANMNITPEEMLKDLDMQIEKADYRGTPIEPFVAENKKMIKLVPKKNLIPTSKEIWYNGTINGNTGSFSASSSRLVLKQSCKIPVKPNTTYTISAYEVPSDVTIREMYCFDKNDVYISAISGTGYTYTRGATFKTPANAEYFTFQFVPTNDARRIDVSEVFDKVQLEEASMATEVEPFELIEEEKSYKFKASRKKYPFDFVRRNPEVMDSVLFGKDMPRIIDGKGIVIEDDTTNLVSGRTILTNTGTLRAEYGDRMRFQASTNGSNSTGGYIASTAIKANTDYTLSFKMEEFGTAVGKVRITVEKSSGNLYLPPIKIGDRYYVSFNSGTATSVTLCFYLTNTVIGEYFDLYRSYQLEEKKFATSYTDNKRSKENLAIVDAGKYIDTERGSIEMEFTPLAGDNIIASDTWGLSDLSCYIAGTGGFLLRRSYGRVNRVELIIVSPVSGINIIQYDDNVGWKNGDTIKYRLDWDKSTNKTALTVNNTTQILVSSMFKTLPEGYRYSLNLGSRGMVNESYGCGSAIYKSLIIRNRNGETTFRL
jgi:hypothetical protein